MNQTFKSSILLASLLGISFFAFRFLNNSLSQQSESPTVETVETSTGYTYAVECIEANRAFLIAEVHAYIAVTYPSYTYTIAACTRDVNRYLDAIKYDLIYTGNWRTLNAAT